MAKSKNFLKSDPIKEFEAQLNADFNQLIRKVHRSLSTKKRSPVWTGFFASSWKAQTMGVQAKEDARNFSPWREIRRQESIAFFNGRGGERPRNPKIQIRYPVKKTFNYKKPVFIGNRAKHAAYALEGGKVQVFVQGELGKLIKETMREKKGKLFVASQKSLGFGASEGGVSYTEF